MPIGSIIAPEVLQTTGIATATTDHSMQMYCKDQAPYRNVGYVTKEAYFDLYLWNGGDSDTVLSNILYDGAFEGISISVPLPVVIPSRSSKRVLVTVTLDGPVEYLALFQFIAACGFNPSFSVEGTRAPQLATDVGYLVFPHDWEKGLDETLTWKTDVMVAVDRTEQRVQLRSMPRRTWDLKILTSGDARRKLETYMGMGKARRFLVPIWRDLAKTTGAIQEGEILAPVADVTDNLLQGTPVVIWDAFNHFEVREVVSAQAGYFTVDAPFAYSWPAGTLIAPARYCFSFETRRAQRFTEDVGIYTLRVLADDDAWNPISGSPEYYKTVEVCPFIPSWEGAEETLDNKWTVLDNDTGVLEFEVHTEEAVRGRPARFLLTSREAIYAFMTFLSRRAGKLTPFWLAATDRGVSLAVGSAADSSTVTIQPIDYEFVLSESNARKYLEFITTDGTVIRRSITSVETLPSGLEVLTLDDPLGVEISDENLNRCTWFELVRLDADEILLHWVSQDCLEVLTSIMVLP